MLSKRLVDKKIIFLVIIIAVFLILNIEIDYWSLRRNLDSVKYLEYIENYSAEYGIEKELLAAVIYVESRFDPYSESIKGAQGLMQIMPSTAYWIAENLNEKDFSIEKLKEPETNIKFGSWYFSYLYHKFDKDLVKTLAAYNAGQTNVFNWIQSGWQGDINPEKIKYRETYNFINRVISTRDYYKNTGYLSGITA